MAKKRTAKQRRRQWLGFAAVAGAMAVLALLVLLLPRTPVPAAETTASVPETTAPPILSPNPYTAGDFTYQGDFLTIPGGRIGIDVSSHQGQIDWTAVAESPVEFAMIRLGYRGYGTGVMIVDDYARANLSAAGETEMDLGVYFFSQAITVEEARQEANFLLKVLDGRELELPVVFDWEFVAESARTGGMDRQTLTDCALMFCQTVQAAGYTPMVYFNSHMAQEYLDLEALAAYDFWLAQYGQALDFPYELRMWQYSETGAVPGIEGNVDLNIWLP